MKKAILTALCLIAGFSSFAAAATAQTNVDCSVGTIGGALGSGATNIQVLGTCSENVTVTADDVRISGGTIQGAVTVNGAQRFVLNDVSLVSPAGPPSATGLHLVNGATAGVFDVEVSGFPTGVAVNGGAFAEMNDVRVPDCTATGLLVTYGASAAIREAEVSGCETGIDVRHGSSARIADSLISGNDYGVAVGVGGVIDGADNHISDNVEADLDVFQHGTYRGSDETIERTLYSGPAVFVARLGHLDLRGTAVTGDVDASLRSYLRLRNDSSVSGNLHVDLQATADVTRGSNISGDVLVENHSIFRVLDGATVGGDIVCLSASICL